MAAAISIKRASVHNLKAISLDIPLGRMVAIVGPSGSGKSTLVYDIIYRESRRRKGQPHDGRKPLRADSYEVGELPEMRAISQAISTDARRGLGEINMQRLKHAAAEMRSGELLIADEPCAGLTRDERIEVLSILRSLVARGVSVIVVEHCREIIDGADYVVEFGPGAGKNGGEIIFQGNIADFRVADTLTSRCLAAPAGAHKNPDIRKDKKFILKHIDWKGLIDYEFTLPLYHLVCVYGRSGSGKTSLLESVYRVLFKGKNAWRARPTGVDCHGKQYIRRSYLVEQTPLSADPTSTPCTYLGIWEGIRHRFAALGEARVARFTPAHFSFNMRQGQCPECRGTGVSRAGDTCSACGGKRFKEEVLQFKYNGRSIADVLAMTVDEALLFFDEIPFIRRKLQFLHDVGLGYLELGQPSGSLSGGEAQRVRLAEALSKKLSDRCVYLLDTPSRGLHLADIPLLAAVLRRITEKRNAVLIADNREELIDASYYALEMR